jgi:hypothetical protein
MSEPARRVFLRSALGAGGLLLPWRGSGALALADPGAAARLPVVAAPLPVSEAGLEVRNIVRAMQERPRDADYHSLNANWRALRHLYVPWAEAVLNRPARSWSDCVEIAEIAWHWHPKAWRGPPDYGRTDQLEGITGHQSHATSIDPPEDYRFWLRPVPALIEAVLTLGGGERLDPQWDYVPLKRDVQRRAGR